MEPEPEAIDLSVLDPSRDAVRFERAVSAVASRALELRRLRRVIVRRGVTALALAMAAGLALWLSAPRRAEVTVSANRGLLDWATREVGVGDLFDLGGSHAQ